MIVKSELAEALNSLPKSIRDKLEAVAETIDNNVRSKIIKKHLNDPAFFGSMSVLLGEIIAGCGLSGSIAKSFLRRMVEVAQRVQAGKSSNTPAQLDTPGKRALYNNLSQNESFATQLDETIRRVRPNGWRGNQAKENEIKKALLPLLNNDPTEEVERIFPIIKAQVKY